MGSRIEEKQRRGDQLDVSARTAACRALRPGEYGRVSNRARLHALAGLLQSLEANHGPADAQVQRLGI
ncbi:MAG: hypothetical protein ABW205_12980, partial [Burkholderiales bacterium]